MRRRIISRLDVKMQHLIKGMRLEGWRKVGDPEEKALQYYAQGVDELIYMDVVASLYERNNLADIVERVASQVFIPITVGGGISSLAAVKELLAVGADKVAINTAATKNPELITDIAGTYGAQATVLSIEAKSLPGGGWEAMTDNGRNHTGRDVVEWAKEGESRGAGEIFVTSVDQDGTGLGMDLPLIDAVANAVNIPVIACGGVSKTAHVTQTFGQVERLSAIAMARALHYDQATLSDVRVACAEAGIDVRDISQERNALEARAGA